jgi:YidC/Oxa1 family membrane protein insertase
VLGVLERATGNWGVAIILLTLLVRLILFPINRRSQTQMARYGKRMKRVQPQIDELKKRFANDPAKLQKAQAELMQKEGLFPPLGGCLPLFLQLPVFIGLFSALRTSFELRHAPFFAWMIDLSQPDRLLPLGWNTHLPLIGTIDYLNLLPLLMVALSLIQQKTLPTPVDEKAAQMQKMMMFFPVVMCLIFYDYAAGLSLYMITQSVLGILEQTVIKKIWPIDDSEPEPKKKARAPGFFGRLQQRAVEMQKVQEERRRRLAAAGRGKSKRR